MDDFLMYLRQEWPTETQFIVTCHDVRLGHTLTLPSKEMGSSISIFHLARFVMQLGVQSAGSAWTRSLEHQGSIGDYTLDCQEMEACLPVARADLGVTIHFQMNCLFFLCLGRY